MPLSRGQAEDVPATSKFQNTEKGTAGENRGEQKEAHVKRLRRWRNIEKDVGVYKCRGVYCEKSSDGIAKSKESGGREAE